MTNAIRLGEFTPPSRQLVRTDDGHLGRRIELDAVGLGVARLTADSGADEAAASTAAHPGAS